jgi:beta-mannosidase
LCRIPDPFLDTNELAVQWIGEKDWVYKTTFTTPRASQGEGVTTALVFHGLDTFTTVTLNGNVILSTENMHTTYRVDISTFLIAPAFTSEDETEDPDAKVNTLEITFHSALLRGRDIIASYPEHKFYVRQTEAGRVPVRKA